MVAYAVASAAVKGTPVARRVKAVSARTRALSTRTVSSSRNSNPQVDVDLVLRHASDAAYADLGEMQTKRADSYDSFETVVHRQPDAVVLPPLLAETPGEILEQGDWQRRLDDGSIRTQLGLDQGEIASTTDTRPPKAASGLCLGRTPMSNTTRSSTRRRPIRSKS